MTFLAAIAFDPAIRGVLVVMVGVVVLLGSVYLLLATNTGTRAGFLIAMAALTGWLFSLGLFWTMYGIGMVGRAPTWTEKEINFDRVGADRHRRTSTSSRTPIPRAARCPPRPSCSPRTRRRTPRSATRSRPPRAPTSSPSRSPRSSRWCPS